MAGSDFSLKKQIIKRVHRGKIHSSYFKESQNEPALRLALHSN